MPDLIRRTHQQRHPLRLPLLFFRRAHHYHFRRGEAKSVRNECRLLACAPLKTVNDNGSDSDGESDGDDGDDDLATSFDAKHHRQYFEDTFKFYNKDISEDGDDSTFIVCQVADSTALNPAIARAMNFPHISCKNHDLSLEANKMIEDTAELKTVTDTVAATAVARRRMPAAASCFRLKTLMMTMTLMKKISWPPLSMRRSGRPRRSQMYQTTLIAALFLAALLQLASLCGARLMRSSGSVARECPPELLR